MDKEQIKATLIELLQDGDIRIEVYQNRNTKDVNTVAVIIDGTYIEVNPD